MISYQNIHILNYNWGNIHLHSPHLCGAFSKYNEADIIENSDFLKFFHKLHKHTPLCWVFTVPTSMWLPESFLTHVRFVRHFICVSSFMNFKASLVSESLETDIAFMCIFLWRDSALELENELWQTSQPQGFSSLCNCLWTHGVPLWANPLLQKSHISGRSPLWILFWTIRALMDDKGSYGQ